MRDVGPRAAARHRASPPEERSLTDPKFIGSFPRADTQLDPPLPEVAFLGRSNVGKSSLLNALVGRRIAKVSGTPGKTRALNVFLIPASGEWGVVPPHSLYFLDLPGYGYARAGKEQLKAFRALVKYALHRERLCGVVWLLDIRHSPSRDDLAMQDVLVEAETNVLAALTKSDKLSKTQRDARARELQGDLELSDEQMIVTSTRTGAGIGELREAIGDLIARE